ncbi:MULTISPECIES: hypothetical protein [Bombella]|uniref:Uncharacterized protein n=2 Tax=Bombella TaxID=1654741 RepID=A0ABT3WP79_9PROT|nr:MULTISPECIES: hypothetical protein [Bombella]MCT6855063.1 hypothetical protein [Bombella apis]PHI95470.1 hypothetical protein BG621_06870 [Parasaccharibacter apium]MCX5615329.1 hypothetical protein [Bombella saccharophila]MCX5619453.1 hypothetical protein [Bombella pollinis]MUG04925.1 hypothetical protein [Bombella sp. ESL0378]
MPHTSSHEHKAPHASSSLHELARKAIHSPKLLTKDEVLELAHHVLKTGEHATEAEREIAKKAQHNPEGLEAAQITKLGERAQYDHRG